MNWREEGSTAGLFAEAKDYHWPVAYPLSEAESMPLVTQCGAARDTFLQTRRKRLTYLY